MHAHELQRDGAGEKGFQSRSLRMAFVSRSGSKPRGLGFRVIVLGLGFIGFRAIVLISSLYTLNPQVCVLRGWSVGAGALHI